MSASPAIAVLEFDSIAVGLRAADAMVKRAPVDTFRIGTVQPGKYLILIGGSVAAVEESRREGLAIGGAGVIDEVFLPGVHAQVLAAVAGERRDDTGDALGILETTSIPINVAAADKAVKTADVAIVEIRLGDGLGGKGLTLLTGLVHDVEAALAAALDVAQKPGALVRHAVIPIQHGELRGQLADSTRFSAGAPAAKRPRGR